MLLSSSLSVRHRAVSPVLFERPIARSAGRSLLESDHRRPGIWSLGLNLEMLQVGRPLEHNDRTADRWQKRTGNEMNLRRTRFARGVCVAVHECFRNVP
jgi:hypothetical protein